MELKETPVKAAARELGLEVATPERARSMEFVAQVRALKADALVVADYGQILSVDLLNAAVRGGINLHGSILPRYRGAAPIQRSILNGDLETGVTLMQMDRGMDTGDIIEIARTPIGPDETYGELLLRLAEIAAQLAGAWIERIVAGDYPRMPQDNSEATLAPKLAREEGRLHWERAAKSEYDRWRAFSPSPGAFFDLSESGRGILKVHRAALRTQSGPSGTILAADPFPILALNEGSLELLEVQPEGKKRMSGRDWINGLRLRPGESIRHG